jgi:DNA-binding MarR family transcriptional regulator
MGIGKENRKLLLYRLTTIIKALFPHQNTYNPHQEQQEVTKYLDQEEQLLFNELVHSITLLNGFSRINNQNQIISTKTDLVNALQLTLPKELQLTQKNLNIHSKLSEIFDSSTFDYVSAGSRLKTSKTTLKRQFRPLIAHGLIKQLPSKESSRALFQIIKITEKTELNTSQEIFEIMQGDWKDFIGFVEF